jgi:hypothetical protein
LHRLSQITIIGQRLSRFSYTYLPAAPNIFMEAKGPHGLGAECRRQACYYGAIGARVMYDLEIYSQNTPVNDNKALTISNTYHEGTLKIYAYSTVQPNGPGTKPEYYMLQIDSWSMSNKRAFIEGATPFKNALDMTREDRDDAITHANENVSRLEEHDDVPRNETEQWQEQQADEDGDSGDDHDYGGRDSDEEEQEKAESSFMVRTTAEDEDDEKESKTSLEDGKHGRTIVNRVSKRRLISSPQSPHSIRSGRRRVGSS